MKKMPLPRLFWELLKADFVPFRQFFLRKIINITMWVMVTNLVAGYVFPHLGMTNSFGPFYATGAFMSVGVFEINAIVAIFLSDFAGDRFLTYGLTLPWRGYHWYVYTIISHAVRTSCIAIFILPIIKFLLWNRLVLSNFSFLKFIVIFLSGNIFIGVSALLFASIVKNLLNIQDVWFRFLFPLWFFGGSQYSWQTLNQVSPSLSYVAFFNPFLYAYEGMRGAILGSDGYISFGVCIFMLWIFIFIFGIWGFLRLKRWLDFV